MSGYLVTEHARRRADKLEAVGTPTSSEFIAVSDRDELRAGVRAMAPMVVVYVPFALLVGSAAASSANPLAAWLATWTIYGGAAHLAVLEVLAHGSGWVAAALVGLLVNARLSAYAAAMAPEWRSAPLARRALAGALLTDAPWALAQQRTTGSRAYYLGAALTLFVAWPTLVTLGMFVAGDWLTGTPVTAILPALTLGTGVVPQLRQRPVAVAVGAASVTALATASLDAGPALLACAAVGAAAGLMAESRS
jgi:predicted branched-subunit amino acid permease